ncbi:MAG: LysM peptidoglycan-binding domain-containing protein [Planctomycetes bacterium]|nr:LysM peptidoglycan-binding domain-containing protein [Planctomycetota bacterium]
MGQIERYGLYVLVLVIFLILGVAIWGDDSQAVTTPPNTDLAVREQLAESSEQDEEAARSLSEALRGQFAAAEYDDPSPKPDPKSDVMKMTAADLVLGDVPAPRSDTIDGPAAKPEPKVEDEPAPNRPIKGLPDLRRYKVSKGDTLMEISKKFLGSARQWQRIVQLNPQIDPDQLDVGTTLLIPHREDVLEDHLRSIRRTGGTYTVVKGDSLARIAKRLLGSEKYAAQIRAANDVKNVRKLQPGDVLVIPAVETD